MKESKARSREFLRQCVSEIKAFFGERIEWINVLDGYNGHLRLKLYDVSYKDLRKVSDICGTMNINVHHEPASGSEFTPSGDFMEVVVWGPSR